MRCWALILLSFCSWEAMASYRVYKLKIYHYDNRKKIETIETILTNLDPYQYENYHAGSGYMKIKMIDTWYCPGDTRLFRKYCKPPKVRERGLASFDHAKRALPYHLQPIIP